MPPVDPIPVEIVTETSEWLVSTERPEVSSKEFVLTVTKVVLGVVVLAAAVSPSVVLLPGSGVSTVVSGMAGSVALAPDKVSADVMVSVMSDSASVESSKADTSEGDMVFPPVGS